MSIWQKFFRSRWLYAALFLLALAPRLLAIGRYVTPDELMWVQRSVAFREALLAGDWANTIVTGHPGVTTTWLGALGISLQLLLRPGDTAVYQWITHLAWMTPDNVTAFQQLAHFLTAGRLMVALANSVGLVLAFRLLVVGNQYSISGNRYSEKELRYALFVVVLLALDPFMAGLSGLLHVDGLLTTFALLALLCLARGLQQPRSNYVAVALSGSAAALAALSKTPGVLLVPLAVGVFWLQGAWVARAPKARPFKFQTLLTPFLQTFTWLASFAIVAVGVLPALVAAPGRVWQAISGESGRHIENALRPTFFMGQAAFDHGPLFYPVALLLRLSPVVLVGLLYLIWNARKRKELRSFFTLQNLILLLWAVGFVAAITLAAKKFDRYMLPAIPALTLLAAWGWAQLKGRRWVLPALVGLQLVYLLVFVPYPLTAFNPLAGGPWVAQRAITVGWGEAIGAAGRWLAAQPGAEKATAVANIAPALAPFFPGQTLLDTPENRAQADFVIVTLNGRQLDGRQLDGDLTPVPGAELLHVLRYGGLPQAWIYRNPAPQPPPDLPQVWPQPLTMGSQVQLWGFDAIALEDIVAVYLRWGLAAPTENRFSVRLTLRDGAGNDWGGLETALLNDVYFHPAHWTPGAQPVLRYDLPRPAALPPGDYTVELSLFDGQSAQVAVNDAKGVFRGVTVTSGSVAVPPRGTIPSLAALDIPVEADGLWLDGALRLRGHSRLPEGVLTGGKVTVDLFWQGERPLPARLPITLTLGGRVVAQQLVSRYDTGLWRPGELVQEKVTFTVPPDMAGGEATLTLQVEDRLPLVLGMIFLQETDRLFVLPEDVALPLVYDFGGVLVLRGMSAATGRAGETAVITLTWQIQSQPATLYTAFVHLLNPEGSIATQSDQWPGGRPTDSYVPGEVVVDAVRLDIPPDLPPGEYGLRVGVYTAVDGVRLPVQGEDFVLLPLPFVVRP